MAHFSRRRRTFYTAASVAVVVALAVGAQPASAALRTDTPAPVTLASPTESAVTNPVSTDEAAEPVEAELPTLRLIRACDYTVTFAVEGGNPATYTNLAAEAYSDSPDVYAGKFVTAGTTDSITTPEYPSIWTFYVSAVDLQGDVVSGRDSFATTLPAPSCEPVEPVLPTLRLISACDYTVTFVAEGGDPNTYTNPMLEGSSDNPDIVLESKPITVGIQDSVTTPSYASVWNFGISVTDLQGLGTGEPGFSTTLPGPPCVSPTPEPTESAEPGGGVTPVPPIETAAPSPTPSPSLLPAGTATLAATGAEDVSAMSVGLGAVLLVIGAALVVRRRAARR